MADSSKEQINKYFAKKETKEQEQQKQLSKKAVKKIVYWLVIIIIISLIGWLGYKSYTAPDTPEVAGEYFKAQSREHIAVGASHPDYNSNPPTGGWHYNNPVQAGIYDKELPDEPLIHNLEHGHVWISYRPDLDPVVVNKLAEIAKSYGSKMIVAPRAKNDTAIAVSAWEYLFKLDQFDEMQIRGFIKAHRDKGPEKIPAMSEQRFKDFRQK